MPDAGSDHQCSGHSSDTLSAFTDEPVKAFLDEPVKKVSIIPMNTAMSPILKTIFLINGMLMLK